MPSKKEWIVDEKGYHAKSVWEPSPSSKSPVGNDESDVINSSPQKACSPYAKIIISEVELLPGSEGFEFNKKCKAKATVDVKDESISKRMKFRLYCNYNGTDYEIKPPVEGVINDNNAEAEMTLYYGDKKDGCTYYEDSLNNPSLTCNYIARASHPDTSVIKESKPISMPQKKESEFKLPSDVKYFVVHDTAGELSKKTVEEWKPADYTYKKCYRGHVYIFKDGTTVKLVPFNKPARATKTEWDKYNKDEAWGKMIHCEIVYKDGPPSEKQYQTLAKLYRGFYKENNNKKLIIVPHREIDRGFPSGHSDPTNFNFDKFYKILKDAHNIEIAQGTEGITQERYNYPNQADMVQNFPPVLSGKPKRE